MKNNNGKKDLSFSIGEINNSTIKPFNDSSLPNGGSGNPGCTSGCASCIIVLCLKFWCD